MGCPSGSLEDKNAERNADNGSLSCEVFKGIKDSVHQGQLCDVFELRPVISGQLGLSLTMASTTNVKLFVLHLGQWMLVS